ncbi:SpoIIE family protein phosphatase [Streptomyces sp. NPDC002677]|uniref:ATP-binding SpoIIE family protein phosphatase n=1 Tax=Streptomyces sp. NPDC002677 TaxID=3154774 RepID=UPI00331C88C2
MIAVAGDDPLMVVDGSGIVVQWSRQAEALLGRGADEVLGRSITPWLTRATAVTDQQAEPIRNEVALYDASGHVVAKDLRVRPLPRQDGSLVWGLFQAPADGAPAPDGNTVVLEALFTRVPVGLYFLDMGLHIAAANVAAQTMCGGTLERILGRRLTDAYEFSPPGEVEAMLRAVLDSGAPSPRRVVYVSPRDRHGAILGVAAVLVAAGDRERALASLRVWGSVRERVGQTLDVLATCRDLVEALVPGFADAAVVEVVDAVVRGEEPPLAPLDQGVPLRRVAFRHGDVEQQVQAHPVDDVRALPFPTPYAQTLADLKPRVVPLGPDTPWLAADPLRARAIRASGVRALLVMPLTLYGTVIGLISLYRTEHAGAFDEKDVALAKEVADYTALCINDARHYTREHTIATTIQRHLLPPWRPSDPTLETATLLVPGSQGAGGWVDIFALPNARTALVVGEVAGQGIHTATTMGQLRTAIHTLAALDVDPDELLARLNDTATRLASERAALPTGDPLRHQPLTASCAYAVYDPIARTCTIARADHPPPVITHPDGTTEIFDHPSGPPLGSTEGPPFAATTVGVTEGSILALHTVSLLPSCPSGRPGKVDSLREVLGDRPERPVQEICDDALYRLHGDNRPTDTILLLARTRAIPADEVAVWHLDHHPSAAGTARTRAREQLATWGVDDETAYATEVIVSELVTNAVRYGSPPVRLRIIKHRVLTCEVQDTGALAPRLRHARTVDEGGRGLFICAQLAQTWGVRYTSDGKTVWTEQPLPLQPGRSG